MTCAAGKYRLVDWPYDCQDCPAGTMSPAGSAKYENCEPNSCGTILVGTMEQNCGAGYFSDEGASSCTPCAFPQYSVSPGSCQCSDCVKLGGVVGGKYVDTNGNAVGYRRCETCPDGKTDATHAHFSGKTYAEYQAATLEQIVQKIANGEGDCRQCPANYWKDMDEYTPFCIGCTAGTQSTAGSGDRINKRHVVCSPCAAGYGHHEMPGCDIVPWEDACLLEDRTYDYQKQLELRGYLGYVGADNYYLNRVDFDDVYNRRGQGCVRCPAGKFSMLAYDIGYTDTDALFAPLLFGVDAARVCQKCAWGKYAQEGDVGAVNNSVCTSCFYNEYTTSQGSVGQQSCLTPGPGQIVNSYRNGVEDCPAGTIAFDTNTSLECRYCSKPDEFASENGVTCGHCAAGEMLFTRYDKPKPEDMTDEKWDQLWLEYNTFTQNHPDDRIVYSASHSPTNQLLQNSKIQECIPCRPPYWCPGRTYSVNPTSYYPYTLWSIITDPEPDAYEFASTYKNQGIYRGFLCSDTEMPDSSGSVYAGEVLITGATNAHDNCIEISNLQVVNRATDESRLGGLTSYYKCDVGYGIGTDSHVLDLTSLPSSSTSLSYPKCEICAAGKYSEAYDERPCLACDAVDTCVGVDARWSGAVSSNFWGQVVPDKNDAQILRANLFGKLQQVEAEYNIIVNYGAVKHPVRYNCGGTSAGVCGCPYASGWDLHLVQPSQQTFCKELSDKNYLGEEYAVYFNSRGPDAVLPQNILDPGIECDARYSTGSEQQRRHCTCDEKSFNIRSDTDWDALTYLHIASNAAATSSPTVFTGCSSDGRCFTGVEGVTASVGNCYPCPAGQQSMKNSDGLSECTPCPSGHKRTQYLTHSTSGYEFQDDNVDLVCEACLTNTEANEAQDACEEIGCPVGREWNPTSQNCQACPAFHTRPQELVNQQNEDGDTPTCQACTECPDDKPIMLECDSGDESADFEGVQAGASHCVECSCTPGVDYCANPHDAETCMECNVAQCGAGETWTACANLNAGTCETCPDGTFNTDGGECQACTQCQALFRKDQECQADQDTVCEACAVGHWSPSDSVSCQVCSQESFSQLHPFNFDPCCEYNPMTSMWWCGTSGNTNNFLSVHGVELDITDEHSNSWDCQSRCGMTPSHVGSDQRNDTCPTNLHVTVQGFSQGRIVDFYKSVPDAACQLCDTRWSVGTGSDKCELGARLVGCGGSSSEAAGVCTACAGGEYHDACTDTCNALSAKHRVVVAPVSVGSIPGGYSCTAAQQTETEQDCGVHATSWQASFDASGLGIASSDTKCHCEKGSATQDSSGGVVCLQCAANKYGVVYDSTDRKARETECLDCPDATGHNALGQQKAACKCSPGFEVRYDGYRFECRACRPGMFKEQRSTEAHFEDGFLFVEPRAEVNLCQPCEAGTYQEQTGASVCKPCPVAFFCPEGSVNPIVCPNLKTSEAGATRNEDCFCDASTSLINEDGNCVTKEEYCEADFYKIQQSCATSCENGVTQAEVDSNPTLTADCAITALSHAEALTSSHDAATASDIWLQEALVRVAWMQSANVNLEVMPYPTDDTDAANPVYRLAVIYEKTFYDAVCQFSPLLGTDDTDGNAAQKLRLTHTYVWDREWNDATASTECFEFDFDSKRRPKNDEHDTQYANCPRISYRDFAVATLAFYSLTGYNDFAYFIIDNTDPVRPDGQTPTDYSLDKVSMQWSTALLHCKDDSNDDTGDVATTSTAFKNMLVDSDGTTAWTSRNDQWFPRTSGANAWRGRHNTGTSDLIVGGYTDSGNSLTERTERSANFIAECDGIDKQDYCEVIFDDSTYNSQSNTGNTLRFVRTPPRQTLPRHRAPGLRGEVNTGKFFDRRPTVASIIPDSAAPCSETGSGSETYAAVEYKGSVLCLEQDALESDIVTFSVADGTCSLDSAPAYPCYENIATCLNRVHAILLPAPYEKTGASQFKYDTTVLHMPYSADAHAGNVFSGMNGAVFDFVPIYGYILEVRSDDCSADAVQKRVYMPLDVGKSVSILGADCETSNTAGAFTGMASSLLATDYSFLSVLSVYLADLPLDAAKTFVRMRTWTAYGYSEPSAWQAMLDLSRICEACPANSNSPINSGGVDGCLCEPGYTRNTATTEAECIECVSGKYKAAAGNEPCTNCAEADNHLWASPSGSTNSDLCVEKDLTLQEQKISNLGVDGDIHPIVVCVNLKTATLRAQAGVLIEYDCATINPCPAAGDSDALQPGQWYHRSHAALALDNEAMWDTTNTIYNHHHIEYARIPWGVSISTAAPNFIHYKESDEWHPDTSTIRHVLGTCDHTDTNNVHKCVQDIRQQNDFHHYSGVELDKSYNEGTTQMIKFTIDPSFTCNDVADDGYRLVNTEYKPTLQVACEPKQPHGAYTSDPSECTLACNAGYEQKEGDSSGICKRKCDEVEFPDTTCSGFKAANYDDTPTLCPGNSTYFKCHECQHVDGQQSNDFDPANPTVCQRTPCSAGSTTPANDGVCVQCPVHTKQVGTTCEPCTPGTDYQPTAGSNTCIPCQWSTDGASCDAGFYAEANFAEIQQYLDKAENAGVLPGTDLQKHFWCARGYACLPCMPGTFKSSTAAVDECTPCAIGDYQNTHGQTACFDCASTADAQVTAGTGSISSNSCQCNLGYGAPDSP